MTADAKQPKSILKHSQAAPNLPASLPTPKSDAEKRRLEIAIEHAHLIQDQKNAQAKNLNSVEELSDIPLGSEPTTSETERFLSLVSLFQPSDYDALIEERLANGRCGYTLCPNRPRHLEAKYSWLRPKGSQNWCSDECARKALYVKAQLDEAPAWERRGDSSITIVLRPEGDQAKDLPLRLKENSASEDLALERGEKASSNKVTQVSTAIVEKETRAPKPSLGVRFDDFAHQNIEGYRVSNSKIKPLSEQDQPS